MRLSIIGRLIGQQRRAQGLTLAEAARRAGVGRSTLAALESGKLPELGFSKIARLCDAMGLVLEARTPLLSSPLMAHRHLTEAAGRDLTKSAIEDVILNGDFTAWRGLVKALRDSGSEALRRRVSAVASALEGHDVRARAFAVLIPQLLSDIADGSSPQTRS